MIQVTFDTAEKGRLLLRYIANNYNRFVLQEEKPPLFTIKAECETLVAIVEQISVRMAQIGDSTDHSMMTVVKEAARIEIAEDPLAIRRGLQSLVDTIMAAVPAPE